MMEENNSCGMDTSDVWKNIGTTKGMRIETTSKKKGITY